MFYGISIYQTDEYKTESNIEYIKKAGEIGYNLLFTSLHLPEQSIDYKVAKELIDVIKVAKAFEMVVFADISPSTLTIFKDLEDFYDIGINTLRIDYGFSVDKIAKMTLNKYGVNICINA
ncbi:MupG family TIM beta-alpha barrel fold protein, partial [Thermovenabulum sp.]|uniref:MupG family TIM beta-alpha barrel fold protein n=1 Tax=Thermovenabulum sp. TaxID=3100335 RepID=UPI003C7E8725